MYLKTTYPKHCEEDDGKCADHCRVFALSDAGDTDFQKVYSHMQSQREVWGLWEAEEFSWRSKGAISEYTVKLGKYQAEDYLCEAKNAAAKIFEWRGHILRAENQDQYKLLILWREMKHLQ